MDYIVSYRFKKDVEMSEEFEIVDEIEMMKLKNDSSIEILEISIYNSNDNEDEDDGIGIEDYEDYEDYEEKNENELSILFPNADSEEQLDEELEHILTTMIDN